jgi:multidrug efflux system outer membrane protein
MQWESVFQDDVLRALIKEALTNNYDMRIAVTRIQQAEANVGITRANQFPTLEGDASIINERNNFFPHAPTFDR